MAGNVAEWTLNAHSDSFVTAGGAWDGPLYLFGDYGTYPGSYTSETLGFRCACTVARAAVPDRGSMRFQATVVPRYQASTDQSFRMWRRYYSYDKAELDSTVVEVQDTPEWRREEITYRGARDRQVTAYLYLPKSAKPPFQVFQYMPGAMVFFGFPITDAVHRRLAPHIRYGRAVFLVALDGYAERRWPTGQAIPKGTSIKFRDLMVEWAVDLQRGLDYLQSRSDIDMGRIALGNVSTAFDGLIFAAIERRYRSVVLIAAGVDAEWTKWIPEANPVNFAPHIRAPKLMLSGRYDEAFSFRTQIEPLFRLLREPKRLEVFDGGHLPPLEVSAPAVNKWLDETLGPVRR